MKKAILYLNLGTPDQPDKKSVGRYLRQFLMDPLVIDIPYFFRWFLVNLIIVPFRSSRSAHAYQAIWGQNGSPLLVYSKNLASKIDLLVKRKWGNDSAAYLAMRYGQPSLNTVCKEIIKCRHESIYLLPAYPQFALSSTESAFVEAEKVFQELGYRGQLHRIQSYFEATEFTSLVANKIAAYQKNYSFDHLLFSYHGLPKRHLTKLHSSCQFGSCCLGSTSDKNKNCYRHQCYVTTNKIVKELNLDVGKYSIGFQSRLGSGWIEPFSDIVLKDLAKQGVKKLAVVCPSFTADCLETLEEIALRAKEDFIQCGGHDLHLIPCLNDDDSWAEALVKITEKSF